MNKKYNLIIPLEFDPEISTPQEVVSKIRNRILCEYYNELPNECEITFTDGVSFKIYEPKIEERK